ncbi:MAG: hypothetical protein KGI68_13030 [Alphaproteobacteria bacterium]|nr:hypothetical protein [Alphaproteobacteria bacterium]MDE1985528.1 hypothetical protein [Alphaproteobacteria bacterium]MDE2161621.1 hypothetical protein [Alphaproteobacteria bacterium]MDE2266398.1 hypothetical protein [Alphaproteobacteria bacterium]MDE2501105.1 hypothetical protein [Alphaproteobacteria bacterium]
MKYGIGFLAVLCIAGAAYAQDNADPFADGADGAKVHTASGFVCPQQVGHFERDAVGERDPEAGADFCAYSALDGVYGTVTLEPLHGAYDPKAILAPDFVVQEGTGGRMIDESTRSIGAKDAPLSIYTRTYETAKLESLHYRTLFASALLGAWTVQVTIEYADPRDNDAETEFLNAAYRDAMANIAGSGQPAPH